MRKTIGIFSKKIVNRAVLAGIAFSGFSFAGNAYAELAISKQLTAPMTKIEGNKYRVDFSMRVLNSGSETISGIVIKDAIKADLEAKGIKDVSQHPGVEPRLVEVPDGDNTSVITGSPNTASAFLASEEGNILGGAELKAGEFLVLSYALDIDFGENKVPVPTNSRVFSENVERDTSNNGEFPENHALGYEGGNELKDSPTTIYFPEYDNDTYTKDSICKVALGGTAFESSYELIKNGGFFTKPEPLAEGVKFIASDTLLADSFKSAAQYVGNNAYPSHEITDGRIGAQISIRNDVALHSNSAQQYPFPGDSARPFIQQTNSWLFFHGNKTGTEVDIWKQDVELVKDKTYNFSMYVSNGAWPDPVFAGGEHPELQVLVGDTPVEIKLNNVSMPTGPVELPADNGKDEWKLVEGTFVAPIDGSTTVKIRNSQNGHNYNYLAITGIGLHRCGLPEVDSDGDGISDENENAAGSNPDSEVNTVSDIDGDGTADHLDANDNNGGLADIDNDGLTNDEEKKLGTNPNSSDTDGDGKDDKTEVGDDVKHPLDSDNDCKIDALESSAVDSDGDGIMDDKDAQPTSCIGGGSGGGGGGGGSISFGLLALTALPIVLRRRRKDS